MSKVLINHNPYTGTTKLLIDGSIPAANSNIKTLFNKKQRIRNWIGNLPERLIDEYEDEEFEFEYYGIAEDYAVVKENLEMAECVETIVNKGGYFELDEAEEIIARTIKDMVEHFPENEAIISLQKSFAENEPPKGNVEKRVQRINAFVDTLNEFIANLARKENLGSTKASLDEKETGIQQEISKCVSDFKKKSEDLNNVVQIKKANLSDNAAPASNLYTSQWINLTKRHRPKKSEYFAKGEFNDKLKIYAEQLNGVLNDVNQMVQSHVEKEINEFIKNLNNSQALKDAFNTEKLHIGTNLPKLKLSHIKCPVLNVDDIASDVSDDEKALEKAKKAKKAAKIVGAVSAVAISPIGAVAAVATNAIAKNAANKNGINAYKIYMSLVMDMQKGFDVNTKAINDYYGKVTEIINSELSELADNTEKELKVQKERFIEEKTAELDEIKSRKGYIKIREKWLREVALTIESLNIGKEEFAENHKEDFVPKDETVIDCDGHCVVFGNLEWIELAQSDNKVLLITKDCIDLRSYNEERTDVTWENCSLRAYLNGEWYNNTFNQREKERIVRTKVVNSRNEKYKTEGGEDTSDKVFLLSIDDIHKYFSSPEALIATYDFEEDDEIVHTEQAWWLRTPGCSSIDASYVDGNGDIPLAGTTVTNKEYGVRPAIWVELNKNKKVV